MAGGNLSPRQKMINLMYLVFIAMLALNMSKEVLSAFGLLNTKLTIANTATQSRNEAFYASLAIKAKDQPEQYAAVKAKADQAVIITDKLDSYLVNLKSEMMKTVKADDVDNYEVQDQPDFLDTKFFQGDNLKPGGKEFLAEMNDYRTGMLALFGEEYPSVGASIESNFSTEPVINRDGEKINWLNYNFEGFPMIASLTKLTQIQTDIKSNSSELLSKILAGQQASALAMSQYTTLLESPKSAYYTGEVFDGAIVLGRVDDKTVPNRAELTLDGRKLSEKQYSIEDGKVKLKIGAGGVGEHKIEGKLIFAQYFVILRGKGVFESLELAWNLDSSARRVGHTGSGFPEREAAASAPNPGTPFCGDRPAPPRRRNPRDWLPQSPGGRESRDRQQCPSARSAANRSAGD